jgi:glycosyltransferase involved in cell wall biosynthesis
MSHAGQIGNSQSLVSVVIPSYNAARTITRAIRSALDQDYKNLEVIVADDGSTDATAEIAGIFRDPRIVLVPSLKNHGAAATRNRALRRATGAYVAFLDADDAWLPGKISLQVGMMEQHPKARLATCDCLFFGFDERPRTTFYQRRTPCAGEDAWRVLLAYNFIATPTVLARRTDILDLGGFSESLPIGEDQDLWIRLAVQGELVFSPEVFVHAHNQPASLSHRCQQDEAFLLLSMVGKHLRQQAYRLQEHELRAIWGQRLFDIAANLYNNKEYGRSAPLFWQSARCGSRPLKSLVNVARSAGHGLFGRQRNLTMDTWLTGLARAAPPVDRELHTAMQKAH